MFKEELERRTRQVRQWIEEELPAQEGEQEQLLAAMNYSMTAGGKRLRPVMLTAACEWFGGRPEQARAFAVALEMIHTHSLVHDDLPAIDNDRLRRGRPTTWSEYGESMALLAGDALLNRAYETMAQEICASSGEEAIRAARAMQIIARKTGAFGMLGGQSVDVCNDGHELSRDQLDFIYDLKTGALIEAALMAGAALGGADEHSLQLLSRAALEIGRAFQIQDDILDVTGDEAVIGKPIGSDERNQKTTYVTLCGIDRARADAAALTGQALGRLDELQETVADTSGEEGKQAGTFLRELAAALMERRF